MRYVLIMALLPNELSYMEQNLKEDEKAGQCRFFYYMIYPWEEADETITFCEWRDGEDFFSDIENFPHKECLLISGEKIAIKLAAAYDIASIFYPAASFLETAVPVEADTTARGASAAEAVKTEDDVEGDMIVEGFEEVDFTFLRHVYERHHHLPWTILTTEHFIVREFSMDYLPELFELYAGEGMTDYIEPLFDYETEREYQQAYIQNMYTFYGYGMWIVCEKESGKLIGRAGIESRQELDGAPELGYAIGKPYQGRGYATEVCRAILKYAGECLHMEQLNCLIEPENTISIHLAEKLGFIKAEELTVGEKRMVRLCYYPER